MFLWRKGKAGALAEVLGEEETYHTEESCREKLAWLEEQNIHEAKDFLLLIFSWDPN